MGKFVDKLIRHYNSATCFGTSGSNEESLQSAIESATAFMYCSDERKADLYARLVESGFFDAMGIERRIICHTQVTRWNQEHIYPITDDGVPELPIGETVDTVDDEIKDDEKVDGE